MDYSRIAPVMGNLWSPIAAVSSCWEGRDNAQICVSIGGASIVAEQPRVLVQIYKTNHSHWMISNSGSFALNFPRPDQLEWIRDFGLHSGRDRDKLSGYEVTHGSTGSPLLSDCWGWMDCRVVNAMDGGDMTCFLAEVVDGQTVSDGGAALVAGCPASHPGGLDASLCGEAVPGGCVLSRAHGAN